MPKRQRYTREFKLEAIRLLEQGDQPAADLARQLGIQRNQLYKWKQQFERAGDNAFQGSGANARTSARSENAQLKRRVAELEEEVAILKKAATYFAKELE